MKIIQLIQKPQRRGAEIFAAQLSESLRHRGHEVILVSIFEGSGELPFYGKFVRLNLSQKKRFYDLKGWKAFSEVLRSFQPDLIQANAADTLKFAVFSIKCFGWNTPIVYRNANQMGDFIKNPVHKKFNKWLLHSVQYVISVSDSCALDLKDFFSYTPELSSIIPIGIDLISIDKAVGKTPEILSGKKFILQIGSWVPEKDPLGMIRIFEKLIADLPDLHLVFMGSGPMEKAMIERIEAIDLGHRIHLLPNQQNIFPILALAKALVMPSKIEGLPGVILEGMYCQVPVIAYQVGGIGELLQKGKTGFPVPKKDESGFVQAIKEVLTQDPIALAQILHQAKILVEQDYSVQKVTHRFEHFYQEIVDNHKDRRSK